MAGNRKAATDVILTYVEKILPGSANAQIYRELFESMSDKQFDSFMMQLKNGEIRLAVIAPNMSKPQLSVERNLEVAKELNHDFFSRIWMTTPDGQTYLSNHKYLIVLLPFRRQAQALVKKISIPEDNRSIDDLTGQPTGKSKGSKVSYPETQILMSHDLVDTATELLKYRGGDRKGFNAMNTAISRSGGVSQKNIEALGSTVQSTRTLKTILTSMHLDSTLL